MRHLALIIGLVLVGAQGLQIVHPCAGALLAQSDEKRLPKGHVCARPAARMAKTVHACLCHSHDCTTDPSDPNNRSAHTDKACLSYCDVARCTCEKQDCP